MTEFSVLCSVAHRAELVASRRLAGRTGATPDHALRATLENSAGGAGLEAMIAQRLALKAAAASRLAARAREKAQALELLKARHEGPATPWRAWFDGSAHPNPGRCGIGGVLAGPAGQHIEISQGAGFGNSSQAEYLALIAVLRAAVHAGAQGLTVYGDSKGVIDDVTGPAHAAAASLSELRTAALALLAQIDGVALRWIPRHKNPQADALSQRAVAAEPGRSAPPRSQI